jgi:hypothetical protein
MRKPKYSPPPWSYDALLDRVVDRRGYAVAYETGEDDGRLIAAAPELLAALKHLERELGMTDGGHHNGYAVNARALIARIEGDK